MIRRALALGLGLTLVPALAPAESLQEALTGPWVKVESARLSDQAATSEARTACAQKGFGSDDGLIVSAEGQVLSLEAWKDGVAADRWNFDPEVRGGKLDDGRMALQFSVSGTPVFELTFWRIIVEEAEQSLLDVLGPGLEPAVYLKCPS